MPCSLRGPLVGDLQILTDCRWENRGGREYPSRLCNLPALRSRTITVIAGPHEGIACALYTAFGGPLAPKEIGDPTLEPGTDAYRESVTFWTEHALSGE